MNLSNTLNILLDMDVLVFRASLVGEDTTEWSPAYVDEYGECIAAVVTTQLDFGRSKAYLGSAVSSIVSKVIAYKEWQGEYKVITCLSDKVNFRKSLYPLYKANRTKPKPQLYADVRRYAEENWDCQCYPNLEGDDVLGILGSSLGNTVVCSIDKDMATIEDTTFYNWDKETFTVATPYSAAYAHYYQTLIGDSVDFYPGCKGIGKVKAKKALDEDCSWANVVNIFASKGFTEEDALLQARIAKILTADLWDKDKQCPILWMPKDYLCVSVKLSETKNTKEVAV